MKLLVDRDIADAATAFGAFGDVELFAGRDLTAAALGSAEALIIRSVSRIDANLLEGSAVRYVGTTTAGTDHVDVSWLEAHGVHFTAAPGCNARAVAEHVLCCVVAYAAERHCEVTALQVGILGYGHVGRAVGALLGALGIPFVVNDAPLGMHLEGVTTVDIDDLLQCDVVTLHVPLTTAGRFATRHLLNAARILRLRPGSLLINAARGGVVDERALVRRLNEAADLYAAIDCWESEPAIEPATASACWQASTHIAGHTLEARLNAVLMQQQALAGWLAAAAPAPPIAPALANTAELAVPDLAALLEIVHPLAAHSARVRAIASLDVAARRQRFDEVRQRHGLRREFASYAVARAGLATDTVARIAALGFTLV